LANQQKSRFLAAASHDLRQPLHALELWAGLLRSSLSSAQAVERWENMNSSIASLDTLFTGLLDLSRFDMGSIVPDKRSMSLRRLFKRLDNDFRGTAHAKGLALHIVADDVWICSDPLWIERVLRNLLANAIKYTHQGSITLRCEERADAVRVLVRDTGIGISESDQQSIFDEYYQVKDPERRGDSGVGLGLTIVKRACDLLGHSVSVRSELGAGSEFCVVVPKSDGKPLASSKPSGAESMTSVDQFDSSLEGFVVVVIEDDDNTARAMNELLKECRCVPVVHADADAATAFLTSHELRPQAIIADYRLRDSRTGIDAIAIMRAKYGAIPAALVSGDIDIVERHAERKLDYPAMRKPLDLAKIKSLLGTFKSFVERIDRNDT
jgi:anti-sigma regulatory factor (Ser/Thr protein kinase)/CheY-like chemotaxis protein